MPAAIPAAIGFVGTWWGALGPAAKVWFVVKAAALVASVAYSYSQAAKLRRSIGNGGLDQGRSVMTRDPVAPRRMIYGQCLVSGTIVFIHTTGTKNEYLHLVIMLAGHEVDEIGTIYFNDEIVPLASNAATGKYAGFARVNKKRGVPGDVADADLVAEAPAFWTSNHKLSGCAYLNVRLKWSPDLFPNGLPTIRALVKGKKVYDPRTALTAWSANSALCAADYLMDEDFGKGVALARIRSADLIEAANICDENVVLDNLSTEDRYTTNGTINADQDPAEVLRDLAGAMAGHIVDTGGTWTIRAGAYRSSVLTLTDDDLVGSFSMQARQSRQDTFNRVRGVYISPQNQWAPADFPVVENATYKAADGDKWLERDVQYNFTTSHATAQRLAKIDLERGRQQITCSAMYNLKAMQCMPGDVVSLTRSRLGWSSKLFEVVDWSFEQSGDGDNPTLGIQLNLRETAAGVWDWNNGEETTVDLAPNTTLPNPFSVPTPAAPTLASTSTMQEDGTVLPQFTVDWTTPNNIHVEQGGETAVEYKVQADSDWLEWSRVRGDMLSELIGGVVIGEIYDVRIRFINNAQVRGAYSTTASVTVLGDVTAPAVPTGLAAIAGTGQAISLSWNANTEPDFSEYGVYRNTVNNAAGATLIAEVSGSRFVDVGVVTGTPYWYYLTGIDYSENESAKTAGVTATASASGAGVDTTPPSNPAAATLNATGTYLTSDGSVRARITINVPAMPTGGVILNVIYRWDSTGAGWRIADQRSYGGGTCMIDDLSPGLGYAVAVQAFSAYGYGSAIVAATGSPFAAQNDTTAPGAPSGLTAVLGTGKSISLDWADITTPDFSEYGIYRDVSGGGYVKIAETRASRFVDTEVTVGLVHTYKITAYDRSENQSGYSGTASATPINVSASETDSTAPGAPSAASKTSQGTYTAGDGTVLSYLTMSVPALPSLAKYQNLLWRVSGGGGDWVLEAQLTNTGAQTVRIDDLSPGIIYDVAVQAFSAFAIASVITIATSSPFTAPNKSGLPTTPTGGSLSSTGVTPKFNTGTSVFLYGTNIGWNPNPDSDFSHYEVKATLTDSDAAVDYSWTPSDQVNFFAQPRSPQVILYSGTLGPGYVRVRAINRSGVASAWLSIGNANSAASIGAGTIASQSAGAVSISGGSISNITDLAIADGGTGGSSAASARTNLGLDTSALTLTGLKVGGSGARRITALYSDSAVLTLAGGSATESESISISGRGFTAKPDAGVAVLSSTDTAVGAFYDYDHASNSSSTAHITFFRYDGGNLSSGARRVSVVFVEHD